MNAMFLKLLRTGSPPVQAKELAAALKVSSQEVAAVIAHLSGKGYLFQESAEGIRLIHSPDTPFPWEFPSRESAIHYFEEIDSTMTEARRLASSGAPDFTVVIAETQEKGRGRLERQWVSSLGGLYFTLLLRPDMGPEKSYLINFLSSLVLSQVLNALFQVDARVKWPNDILIDEKKVSGMISEMGMTGNHIDYVNLGIGLNVNNSPEEACPHACSIRSILGKPVSRVHLLTTFLNALEYRMHKEPVDHGIISQWKENTITLGRKVTVATVQDRFSGTALDVDDQGALLLEMPGGEVKRIIYGDCFLGAG